MFGPCVFGLQALCLYPRPCFFGPSGAWSADSTLFFAERWILPVCPRRLHSVASPGVESGQLCRCRGQSRTLVLPQKYDLCWQVTALSCLFPWVRDWWCCYLWPKGNHIRSMFAHCGL